MKESGEVFGYAIHVFGRGYVKDLDVDARMVSFTSYERDSLVAETFAQARVLQGRFCDLFPGEMVGITPFVHVWETEEES